MFNNFNKNQPAYLYGLVFLTGAAVLMVEILGTRILAPFYGSTIFVWSALIIATLAFLSLGYRLGGYFSKQAKAEHILLWSVYAAGVWIMLLPHLSYPVLNLSDGLGLKFGPLLASLLLFGLGLGLLGMVTPLLVRLLTHDKHDSGVVAGRIFAVGTIGSLIGALLSAYVLIPLVPLAEIFFASGALVAFFALIGLTRLKVKGYWMWGAMLVILILLFVPLADYAKKKNIITKRTSFFGTLAIVKVGSFYCLFVDAAGQSCVNPANKSSDSLYVGQISSLITNRQPERILLLGMGGGSVLSVIPENVELDVVELDPAVVELAREYNMLREDLSYNLVYDDARHFIRTTDQKYDIILMDLALGGSFPPYMFTYESFNRMQELLSEQGVVFVRLGFSPEEDSQLWDIVYSTLRDVYGRKVVLISPYEERLSSLNFVAYKGGFEQIDKFYLVEPAEIGLTGDKLVLTDGYNPIENTAFSFFDSVRDDTRQINPMLLHAF